MLTALWLLWWLLPALGIPLVAVGAVLGLCEWSWRKPAGSMGSLGLLGAGTVLCLPLLLGLAQLALERLSR